MSQPAGSQPAGPQPAGSQPGGSPTGAPTNGTGDGQAAGAVATDEQPVVRSQPQPPAPAPKRGLKRSTRVGVLIIAVLALIAGGAFTASYFLDARHYVSTDNAQIDGDKIAVNAPSSGTLLDWRATQGSTLRENAVVGRIQINGGFAQPQQSIKAPGDGVVAVDNGVEGAYVTAGTQLAVGYNFSKVFVTARVDETDVNDVRPGQRVQFTVDAFPGTDFTGVVREIQGGAAGVFSLFPQSNSSGNFQKVTQVIPVKISIDDRHNLQLVPGMNVTVKIRKDN